MKAKNTLLQLIEARKELDRQFKYVEKLQIDAVPTISPVKIGDLVSFGKSEIKVFNIAINRILPDGVEFKIYGHVKKMDGTFGKHHRCVYQTLKLNDLN
ncbi:MULTISPECIES: hypothetical protein [Actinobacillus]|uniref:Uncharacterized protein n=2 Tax=Actinobacillus suis TaxID=716 RepID=K0G361_ACTSU|nr:MULTISPECIES: hypothetical protein [Actinobacillus]AFU18661.1 hypothetical protein ASU2_02595 [Actinobacillus suis H91-0380]EFM95266.1 hypothetical protein appser10_21260 [Actinobacillus pleuropneumoniae serovar 10 str. D13039]MCO4167103.1 hypothetical protein [Actinobacillus suis]MCO4169226.1 hypothetical protein [Actinobacillus suis]MCQ9629830.1 hypothetical protein [Actinobacillus suis]